MRSRAPWRAEEWARAKRARESSQSNDPRPAGFSNPTRLPKIEPRQTQKEKREPARPPHEAGVKPIQQEKKREPWQTHSRALNKDCAADGKNEGMIRACEHARGKNVRYSSVPGDDGPAIRMRHWPGVARGLIRLESGLPGRCLGFSNTFGVCSCFLHR